MNRHDDEMHLQRCLSLIEARLNRGLRDDWSNYDFERLIEDIHTTTGVRLSLTTLKRLSGRIKYDSFPTHTTLNALARYVGFVDWRDFVQKEEHRLSSNNTADVAPVADTPSDARGQRNTFDAIETNVTNQGMLSRSADLSSAPNRNTGLPGTIRKAKRFRGVMWLAVAVPLVLTVYLLVASRKKTNIDSSQFSFRADKVYSVGVPNSVIFHYDASKVPSDSVFIVQTWDISRKMLVDREKHEHSAIYYYPGYFRTKLIVDGTIVKTHDLQIASDGWLCLAEAEPRPIYFSNDEVIRGDSITVDANTLAKYNLPLHPDAPLVRIFNEHDMGSLMNSNFVFETQVKNPFKEGKNACQFVQVLIQGKDDIMFIPLSAKACVGELGLYAYGYGMDSKHGDLSGFGCDLNEWVTVRVETVNKHMKFLINGKLAYELDFPNDPTGIVGVQFRFNGLASVRGTKFESPDSVYAFQPTPAVSSSVQP